MSVGGLRSLLSYKVVCLALGFHLILHVCECLCGVEESVERAFEM